LCCLVETENSGEVIYVVVDTSPVELARELVASDAMVVVECKPGGFWDSLGSSLSSADILLDVERC